MKNLLIFLTATVSLAFLLLSVSTQSYAKQVNYDLPVTPKGSLAVSIFLPEKMKPRSVILIIPGTGGLGDVYAIGNFRKFDVYKPEIQGNLVSQFTDAGFAVVSFNSRGIKRLEKCVSGTNFNERVESLVKQCFVKDVRLHYDRISATADTQKVISSLIRHPLLIDLPIIPLAYSEGAYNIAKLINAKSFIPSSLILVGPLLTSLEEHYRYRFSNQFYFEKIEKTFEIVKRDWVTFAEVVKYHNLNIHLEPPHDVPWGIGRAMGHVEISTEGFAKRKKEFLDWTEQIRELQMKAPDDAPWNGFIEAEGLKKIMEVEVFARAAGNKQAWQDKTSVLDYLKSSYDGKLIIIYGEHDAVVKRRDQEVCIQKFALCRIFDVKSVGHALEDRSGFPSENAIKTLLQAIDIASTK